MSEPRSPLTGMPVWIGLVIAISVPSLTLAVAWGSIQTKLSAIDTHQREMDARIDSLQAQFGVFQNAISGAQVRLQNVVDRSIENAARIRVLENIISALRQQAVEDSHWGAPRDRR